MPPAWVRAHLAVPAAQRRHSRAGGTVLTYRGLPVAVLWALTPRGPLGG